jgi:hypothetical protein
MGKDRAIQKPGGGDIPAQSEWVSLPGQAVVTGTYPRTIQRGRPLNLNIKEKWKNSTTSPGRTFGTQPAGKIGTPKGIEKA